MANRSTGPNVKSINPISAASLIRLQLTSAVYTLVRDTLLVRVGPVSCEVGMNRHGAGPVPPKPEKGSSRKASSEGTMEKGSRHKASSESTMENKSSELGDDAESARHSGLTLGRRGDGKREE